METESAVDEVSPAKVIAPFEHFEFIVRLWSLTQLDPGKPGIAWIVEWRSKKTTL